MNKLKDTKQKIYTRTQSGSAETEGKPIDGFWKYGTLSGLWED